MSAIRANLTERAYGQIGIGVFRYNAHAKSPTRISRHDGLVYLRCAKQVKVSSEIKVISPILPLLRSC